MIVIEKLYLDHLLKIVAEKTQKTSKNLPHELF